MINENDSGSFFNIEIQSWWEVPCVSHFCSLFRASFDLPDFDIEELEEALLTDSVEDIGTSDSLLSELIVRLLRGCLAEEKDEITTSNYQMYLRRLFRIKCSSDPGRINPFDSDVAFHSLSLRTRVEILKELCDFRLDADDISELLKSIEAESLRIEPLGQDSGGSNYWYFYGTRLYREDFPVDPSSSGHKPPKKRARFRSSQTASIAPVFSTTGCNHFIKNEAHGRWSVVCFTEEDWQLLTSKFRNCKHKAERRLYLTLQVDFLPELPRLFSEKERVMRKRMLGKQVRGRCGPLDKSPSPTPPPTDLKDETNEDPPGPSSPHPSNKSGRSTPRSLNFKEYSPSIPCGESPPSYHSLSDRSKSRSRSNSPIIIDDDDDDDEARRRRLEQEEADRKLAEEMERQERMAGHALRERRSRGGGGTTVSIPFLSPPIQSTVKKKKDRNVKRPLLKEKNSQKDPDDDEPTKRPSSSSPSKKVTKVKKPTAGGRMTNNSMSVSLEEDEEEIEEDDSDVEIQIESRGKKLKPGEAPPLPKEKSTKSTSSSSSRSPKKPGGEGGGQTTTISSIIKASKTKVKSSVIFSQSEEDIQIGMHKVIECIKGHRDAWPFTGPVDEEYAPNYYKVIEKPMDLQTMEDKLDNLEYLSLDHFKYDFELIVQNCHKYNGVSEYTDMVDNLHKAFQKCITRFIQPDDSDEEISIEYSSSSTRERQKRLPSSQSKTSPTTTTIPKEQSNNKPLKPIEKETVVPKVFPLTSTNTNVNKAQYRSTTSHKRKRGNNNIMSDSSDDDEEESKKLKGKDQKSKSLKNHKSKKIKKSTIQVEIIPGKGIDKERTSDKDKPVKKRPRPAMTDDEDESVKADESKHKHHHQHKHKDKKDRDKGGNKTESSDQSSSKKPISSSSSSHKHHKHHDKHGNRHKSPEKPIPKHSNPNKNEKTNSTIFDFDKSSETESSETTKKKIPPPTPGINKKFIGGNGPHQNSNSVSNPPPPLSTTQPKKPKRSSSGNSLANFLNMKRLQIGKATKFHKQGNRGGSSGGNGHSITPNSDSVNTNSSIPALPGRSTSLSSSGGSDIDGQGVVGITSAQNYHLPADPKKRCLLLNNTNPGSRAGTKLLSLGTILPKHALGPLANLKPKEEDGEEEDATEIEDALPPNPTQEEILERLEKTFGSVLPKKTKETLAKVIVAKPEDVEGTIESALKASASESSGEKGDGMTTSATGETTPSKLETGGFFNRDKSLPNLSAWFKAFGTPTKGSGGPSTPGSPPSSHTQTTSSTSIAGTTEPPAPPVAKKFRVMGRTVGGESGSSGSKPNTPTKVPPGPLTPCGSGSGAGTSVGIHKEDSSMSSVEESGGGRDDPDKELLGLAEETRRRRMSNSSSLSSQSEVGSPSVNYQASGLPENNPGPLRWVDSSRAAEVYLPNSSPSSTQSPGVNSPYSPGGGLSSPPTPQTPPRHPPPPTLTVRVGFYQDYSAASNMTSNTRSPEKSNTATTPDINVTSPATPPTPRSNRREVEVISPPPQVQQYSNNIRGPPSAYRPEVSTIMNDTTVSAPATSNPYSAGYHHHHHQTSSGSMFPEAAHSGSSRYSLPPGMGAHGEPQAAHSQSYREPPPYGRPGLSSSVLNGQPQPYPSPTPYTATPPPHTPRGMNIYSDRYYSPIHALPPETSTPNTKYSKAKKASANASLSNNSMGNNGGGGNNEKVDLTTATTMNGYQAPWPHNLASLSQIVNSIPNAMTGYMQHSNHHPHPYATAAHAEALQRAASVGPDLSGRNSVDLKGNSSTPSPAPSQGSGRRSAGSTKSTEGKRKGRASGTNSNNSVPISTNSSQGVGVPGSAFNFSAISPELALYSKEMSDYTSVVVSQPTLAHAHSAHRSAAELYKTTSAGFPYGATGSHGHTTHPSNQSARQNSSTPGTTYHSPFYSTGAGGSSGSTGQSGYGSTGTMNPYGGLFQAGSAAAAHAAAMGLYPPPYPHPHAFNRPGWI